MKGLFITFEGIEGCGKSTQSNTLYTYLLGKGVPCVLTKEPGGTITGDKIRQIVLSAQVSPLAELLLFLADRNQHIHEIIKPYLDRGFVVICDRYYHSTYAYQECGRQIDSKMVRKLNEFAIENFHPDITLLVDVPTEVGFQRKESGNLKLDRIEKETFDFHTAVRNAYQEILAEDDNMYRIDGMQDKESIRKEIITLLETKFPHLYHLKES